MLIRFVIVALQIFCIVHVIRRRQEYWWIFLILFVPFVGSVVYLIVVLWPESQRHGHLRRGGRLRGDANTKRRIRQLEQRVALSDTVENRAELAAAYCDDGQHALARECYESCMHGLYEDDPHFLFGLAKACYGEGDFPKALASLERIGEGDVPEYANERDLLRARALVALGRDQQAIELFRKIAPRISSMEAWWRLATLLAKTGDDEGADVVCRRMIEDSMRLNPVFRRREKQWLEHATQRLKSR